MELRPEHPPGVPNAPSVSLLADVALPGRALLDKLVLAADLAQGAGAGGAGDVLRKEQQRAFLADTQRRFIAAVRRGQGGAGGGADHLLPQAFLSPPRLSCLRLIFFGSSFS